MGKWPSLPNPSSALALRGEFWKWDTSVLAGGTLKTIHVWARGEESENKCDHIICPITSAPQEVASISEHRNTWYVALSFRSYSWPQSACILQNRSEFCTNYMLSMDKKQPKARGVSIIIKVSHPVRTNKIGFILCNYKYLNFVHCLLIKIPYTFYSHLDTLSNAVLIKQSPYLNNWFLIHSPADPSAQLSSTCWPSVPGWPYVNLFQTKP